MNTEFEFDRLEQFNFRTHYQEVAVGTLHAIVRHSLLIATLVVISLALAGLLISQLPRQYSAEALVHPTLFARDDGTKPAPLASIDGASLVTSEARVIRSLAMVRTVVLRLGLDRDPEFAALSSSISHGVNWVRTTILPETIVSSALDGAIASVSKKLTVSNDTRSYIISITFTAASPETAANVANAFALEYLRAETTQRLADAVAGASGELAQQSAIYGEKHPRLMVAKAKFEAARARLEAAASWPDVAGSGIAAGAGITLAQPSTTPSGPKGVVIIGLTFVSALVFGVGLAIWLERRKTGFHSRENAVPTPAGFAASGHQNKPDNWPLHRLSEAQHDLPSAPRDGLSLRA